VSRNELRSGWRRVLDSLPRFAACLVLLASASCISETGPVAVERINGNVTPFPGLANLFHDLPDGGSLNIFVAHGMAASEDQNELNLRTNIANRLGLTLDGAVEKRRLLSSTPLPTVTLDDASIWPDGYESMSPGWQCPPGDPNLPLDKCDAPYLDIAYYKGAGGGLAPVS
jgi:hypothetical protein